MALPSLSVSGDDISYTSTTAQDDHTTGSFTPPAGACVIVAVMHYRAAAVGQESPTTRTSSGGGISGTWNEIGNRNIAHPSTGLFQSAFYVAPGPADGSSMTFTAGWLTAVRRTAISMRVFWVKDAQRFAGSAFVQAPTGGFSLGTTPNVVFSFTRKGSPIALNLVNASNPANVTEPSGYTERLDTGLTNGQSVGHEVAYKDPEATNTTTVTWGSTTATAAGTTGGEVDTHPTLVNTAATTSAGATLTSASFTPYGNTSLYAFVTAETTVLANPTMTDSLGGTWTLKATLAAEVGSTSRLWVFARTTAVPASAMTVTVDVTGDNFTACRIYTIGCQATPKLADAIRQTATDPYSASKASSATFGVAPLTTSILIGFRASTSASSTPPTDFVEHADSVLSILNTSIASHAGGSPPTTVTWGSTESNTQALVVEIDTTAAVANPEEFYPTPSAPPFHDSTQMRAAALRQWSHEQNENASGLYIPIEQYDPPITIRPPWHRPTVHARPAVETWSVDVQEPSGALYTPEIIKFKNHVMEGNNGDIWVRDDTLVDKGGDWMGPEDYAALIEPYLGITPGASTEPNHLNTWTPGLARALVGLTDSYYFGVDWSPTLGIFCAVGVRDPETDAMILTSEDGITWVEQTVPADVLYLFDVAWSETLGIWCAVGLDDSSDLITCTSSDGITWTRHAMGITNVQVDGFFGIGEGDGVFVATGEDGTNEGLASSTDGINWTLRTTGAANVQNWNDARWNGSYWILVGNCTGAAGARIAKSSDGATWAVHDVDTDLASFNILGAAWNPTTELWVICGQDTTNTSPVAWWSHALLGTEGEDWQRVETSQLPLDGPNQFADVLFNGDVLAILGNSTGGADESAIFVSRDGLTWVWRLIGSWGGDVFAFACDDDGNAVVVGETLGFWTGRR